MTLRLRCFRFGRRVTLVVCTAVQVPISVLSAVVPNLVAFTVLRTILAAATAGQFNTAFLQGVNFLLLRGYVLNPNNGVFPKWHGNSVNLANSGNHDPIWYLCLVGCVVTSWPLSWEVAGLNNLLYKKSSLNSMKTRMHSSRMRTTGSLLYGGGESLSIEGLSPGRVSVQGGLCPGWSLSRGSLSRRVSVWTPLDRDPPVNTITDRCKNITLS